MIDCVVLVSGGKDSQSCLKLACEYFPRDRIRGLFCDTQFEHPTTYAFVFDLIQKYGVAIDFISVGSVEQKCLHYERFPGGGARFCTDELKIRPTKWYLKALATYQRQGFEVWYGMRSDESTDRAKRYAGKLPGDLYAPHEVMPSKYPQYLHKMGVSFRLPILDWPKEQVFEYLDGEQNPLYEEFDRVGCFPCLAANDQYKEKAFAFDSFGQSQKQKVIVISERIGKSVWTSKTGKRRNGELPADAPCMICTM